MARFLHRTTVVLGSMLLGLALAVAALQPVSAEGVVNASSWTGSAIEGYDPVAYFEEGKPVEGDSDHSYEWMGATWYFASAENRDLFAADPDKYAPQYGGYCAWAVANGYTAKIDPQAWAIVDDKLYLNYSLDVQKQWQEDVPGNITKADANWPGIRQELGD
jgi:YHS domain-containing protein